MRKKLKVILLIIAIIVFGFGILIFLNLPKPVEAYNSSYDLQKIADGSYQGICDNGLIKVEVKVMIKNHMIEDVQLIKHDNGLGKDAEVITSAIIQNQSVEVDTISGATLSSKTILKAVENALIERENNE